MHRTISAVLAGLLAITSPELVLGQAAEPEAVSVQQSAPPVRSAAQLLRFQPLTQNTALLWRTPSDRALLDTGFADAPLVPAASVFGWWNGLSTVKKVGLVSGSLVVIGAICCGKEGALYAIPFTALVVGWVWLGLD